MSQRNHLSGIIRPLTVFLLRLPILLLIWSELVSCQYSGRFDNTPPRFASESGGAEIVVRVKEGPSALGQSIYHLVGEDADGDPLKFGILGTIGDEIIRIENMPPSEASVFLRKGKQCIIKQ